MIYMAYFKGFITMDMKKITLISLLCALFVPSVHALTREQLQQAEQKDPGILESVCQGMRNAWCVPKDGLAPCLHTAAEHVQILLGDQKTALKEASFADSARFNTWLAEQKNSILMVSKDGCPPCSFAHAFLSKYAKNANHHISYISAQDFRKLSQVENDLFDVPATPAFIDIQDGKIVRLVEGIDSDWLRQRVFLDVASFSVDRPSVDSSFSLSDYMTKRNGVLAGVVVGLGLVGYYGWKKYSDRVVKKDNCNKMHN